MTTRQTVTATLRTCSVSYTHLGVEIIIGAYASEKAYRSTFREGNLYQASVDFLLDLARTYQVTPSYVGQGKEDAFSRMTRILEARYDFTEVEGELFDQDREAVEIWTCNPVSYTHLDVYKRQ